LYLKIKIQKARGKTRELFFIDRSEMKYSKTDSRSAVRAVYLKFKKIGGNYV